VFAQGRSLKLPGERLHLIIGSFWKPGRLNGTLTPDW
jgi:hypothetical protein